MCVISIRHLKLFNPRSSKTRMANVKPVEVIRRGRYRITWASGASSLVDIHDGDYEVMKNRKRYKRIGLHVKVKRNNEPVSVPIEEYYDEPCRFERV